MICTTDIIMKSIFVFRIFLSFLFLCFTSSICANKSSGVFISVVKTRILLISLSNSCIKKSRWSQELQCLISHPLLIFPTSLTDELVSEEGTLTLKLMSPFLQHKQASMRKMNVKSPEKETATTAREDGHDSSLRGAPPTGPKQRCNRYDWDIILLIYETNVKNF